MAMQPIMLGTSGQYQYQPDNTKWITIPKFQEVDINGVLQFKKDVNDREIIDANGNPIPDETEGDFFTYALRDGTLNPNGTPHEEMVRVNIAPPRRYILGNTQNATNINGTPKEGLGGLMLIGGGDDPPEASQWFINRANGGDMVFLRSSGSVTEYTNWIWNALKGNLVLNSVETLVIGDSGSGADDLQNAAIIAGAEAIFICGGDQAGYIENWLNHPVGNALINAIQNPTVAFGGTSAGMHLLGAIDYAHHDGIESSEAVGNPVDSPRLNFETNAVSHALIPNVITDTHFDQRDRMGRLITFLARNANTVGLAADDGTAILIDTDGQAQVVGHTAVYFVQLSSVSALMPGSPLVATARVRKVTSGTTFTLAAAWDFTNAAPGVVYDVSVANGLYQSTKGDGNVY